VVALSILSSELFFELCGRSGQSASIVCGFEALRLLVGVEPKLTGVGVTDSLGIEASKGGATSSGSSPFKKG